MKKITITTFVLVLCLILCSCSSIIEPFDFIQNGLKITLDTSFNPTVTAGYTATYRSPVATVYLLRELFTEDSIKGLTLTAYANEVLKANDLETEIKDEGDYLSFVFKTDEDDLHLVRYVCIYEMTDAFWTVQFVCQDKYYEELNSSFIEWASSVTDQKAESDKADQG